MSGSVLSLHSVRNNVSPKGMTRNQPLVMWLQFLNLLVVSVVFFVLFKLYGNLKSLYEWLFPSKHETFHKPVIMVVGERSKLNEELVKQLSNLFTAEVYNLEDENFNIGTPDGRRTKDESVILFTQFQAKSQNSVSQLSEWVGKTFGEVDLLIVTQEDKTPVDKGDTHQFLNKLNKQLLAQFWIVMAFLPGMLRRNSGHILSVALGRTSCLTNAGIVRSMCEELLGSETEVKLQLVETNPLTESYLPALPCDMIAGLIVRSIWQSSYFITIPTIPQYLLLLPLFIIRYTFQWIFRLSRMLHVNSLK